MISTLGKNGMAEVHLPGQGGAYSIAKRAFDVCFAAAGMILFAPVTLLIALAIKLTSPGAVFYRQQRVGLHGKAFSILKFRSMGVGAERIGPTVTQAEDPRITPIGRMLRRTKL